MLLQTPDFIAQKTGYLHSFTAGSDPEAKQ
jgi:hypothetical protein